MYDFIYNLWFIYNECIWSKWEKNPEIYKNIKGEKQRKKFPVLLPSHTPVYEIKADCFPVSENTENKPDLGGTGDLV